MNNEMLRVWRALRAIYGMDLTAATLVVLTKDGETSVKFQTFYFPQEEIKMTDWTPEEDEAFNEVEKHSNLGKQILRDKFNKSSGMDCCTYDCIQGRDCPVRKAKWVGLTDEEIGNIDYANWSEDYQRWNIKRFARSIEAKLKEKNT